MCVCVCVRINLANVHSCCRTQDYKINIEYSKEHVYIYTRMVGPYVAPSSEWL